MNETKMSANWLQISGKIKQRWGKLTDDELTQIKGNVDNLVGIVKERYSNTKEAALHQVNEFLGSLDLKEKKLVPAQEIL